MQDYMRTSSSARLSAASYAASDEMSAASSAVTAASASSARRCNAAISSRFVSIDACSSIRSRFFAIKSRVLSRLMLRSVGDTDEVRANVWAAVACARRSATASILGAMLRIKHRTSARDLDGFASMGVARFFGLRDVECSVVMCMFTRQRRCVA